VKAHPARFPKPEKFKPLDEVQFVYSKPFRIVQDVTVTLATLDRAKAAGTTLTIKGALKYQACDNSICYAPVTVPVAWTISLKSTTGPSSSPASLR
jgi:DsbC/DsbD-like thiol-disulfide interchange protein